MISTPFGEHITSAYECNLSHCCSCVCHPRRVCEQKRNFAEYLFANRTVCKNKHLLFELLLYFCFNQSFLLVIFPETGLNNLPSKSYLVFKDTNLCWTIIILSTDLCFTFCFFFFFPLSSSKISLRIQTGFFLPRKAYASMK